MLVNYTDTTWKIIRGFPNKGLVNFQGFSSIVEHFWNFNSRTLIINAHPVTCLWKLRSRRARSSIIALVRRSSAMTAGRFSSSLMRAPIRAPMLDNTSVNQSLLKEHSKITNYTIHKQNDQSLS